jgi:ADP-ribose pyrophosphatase
MHKPWKLLASELAFADPHFPLERRTYQLPDGTIITDFYITTIADSVHIVPITDKGTVVMIKMYKPAADDFMLQFPAGRFEPTKHGDRITAAVKELKEETGIVVKAEALQFVGAFPLMTTKATEKMHTYVVTGVSVTDRGEQELDETEEIEVLEFTPQEIDQYISEGTIVDAPAIANWQVVKLKFPQYLKK